MRCVRDGAFIGFIPVFMHRMFLVAVLIINVISLKGQALPTVTDNVIAPDLLFERFHSSMGLPDNRIRSIYQDSRGYLWIGTMNGVARYDGYNFKKYYKTKLPNSISGNWAYAICEDGSGNIWIGTKEGLNKFNTLTASFTQFVYNPNKSNSINSNVVNTLQFDKNGKLWVGTPKGLNLFNPATRTFTRFNNYPFNTNICKITPSYGNYLWIATRDGVAHYSIETGKYDFFKIPTKPNAYGDKFWSMIEQDKDLYIATGGDGLVMLPYNSATQSYGNFRYLNTFNGGTLTNTEVFDICKADNGDFWLGTTGLGLAKIENIRSPQRRITFYKNNTLNNESISNNQVFKVFIDRTNVLWCGTEQGLNKLDLHLMPFKYFTFTDKKYKDQIRSLYSTDGKTIWLGTSKSGLLKFNSLNGTHQVIRFPFTNSSFNRSLLIEGNNVWSGTLGGAFKFNQQSAVYTNIIAGHAVFSFLKDSKKNIWVGTNNGLYKIEPNGTSINYLPDTAKSGGIGSGFVRALYEDRAGNIWIGFENNSLEYFNPNTGKFVSIKTAQNGERVFGSIVYSIVEYPKNVIWVGSESGLNKIQFLKNGTYNIKNYFEENGLPDKSINSIIPDDKGNLWLGTIKGLVKFNINNEIFQTYLNHISFNASSSFKVSNNCFLLGCTDGFLQFDPAAITNDTKDPKVVISDLKLFNKSVSINEKVNGDIILKQAISETKEITLDYDNNQFTIEFAAMHFSNPANNLYAYKLEGFNRDWTYVNGSDRSATYTNLDAGEYTFLVKASTYSGKWSNHPQELKITILPPPWKTWWAILFYIVLFNLLLYVFVHYILIQSKQRVQIRFDQKEKEQLKNLNQMKVRFFTDVSHEFRTPLSLIVGPVEDILLANEISGPLKSKVQLIYRNCKKLLYLIDELMTFQKMEQGMLKLNSVNMNVVTFIHEIYENFKSLAKKKNIQFDLVTEQEDIYTAFDPGKMEMVMNNLLFNAFKFSKEGGSIKIHIAQQPQQNVPENTDTGITEWVCITVEDNGKGLSAEEFKNLFQRFFSQTSVKGTGVGLSLTKNLVELHNGVITAESEPDVKTVFKVYLPLLKIADTEGTDHQYLSDCEVSMLVDEPILENHAFNVVAEDEHYRILVVDDNPEVLDYLEMTFNERYEVIRAQNGAEALQYVKEQLPDLIISDVMMPLMDGVELCKAVKTDINISHIPLILLTAKASVENRIEGLQTGADDYIPKPFHPNVLKARVENLIQTRKSLIEKFQADGGVIIPKNITQNPLDEKFLNKVIDSIKTNISNDEFSVEELGSMVAMSRSNLFRKLKTITGQTPIEFIYYIRLKQAMDLLLERKMSMSEIAYEVGFKNPSSFTKSFKKRFGKSPSEYLSNVLEHHKA